ncbi:MAG TPA: hypothetical protein VNY76_06985 [Candidatus Acidoferrales bacterium]|nr:hypothetical protein [Candidatus Acidoferrales bacterium]
MTTYALNTVLAHLFTGSFGLQTTDPAQWLVLFISLGLLTGQLLYFARAGRQGSPGTALGRVDAIGRGIERRTSLPAWAGAGIVVGLWALTTAFVGFMWDVAWHTDLGRDRELFTVPHTLIILGLLGIGVAAAVSIVYATRDRAAAGWRVRSLVIPAGAAVLLVMSAAALVAFPLDDLWHATYGVDVTMWSPTHLVMIGGASLTPLALALLLWEAPGSVSRARRGLQTVILGTVLIGLSTFQLEFDMGVPQWQALYHPLLIALAAGFALTAGRALLGPWGAVRVALAFLVMRGAIALLIGPVLGHTLPHFPLYVVEAMCVEIAFAVTRGSFRSAALGGVLIGTVGIASEWLWMQVWGLQPWTPDLLPMMWVPLAAAIAASVAGIAFATCLAPSRHPLTWNSRWIAVAGVAAIVALLAVPFTRQGSAATVHITQWQVGPAASIVDRNGQRVMTHDIAIQVVLSPGAAAADADWFRVAAWQGGGVVNAKLVPEGGGAYIADRAVPAGGNWKVIVMLGKGSTVAAAPIEMPAEPDQSLEAIPLLSSRTATLNSAQLLLMRENHAGVAWVADVAYVLFGTTVVVWLVALALAAGRVGRLSRPVGPAREGRRRRVHFRGLRVRHTPSS